MNIPELKKKVVGQVLRTKIEGLRSAFEIASQPFRDEIEAVENAIETYQKEVESGTASWIETGDEGYIHDRSDDLVDRRDSALDSLATLRQSFVFLAYHSWERSMQRLVAERKPNHATLVEAGQRAGVVQDEQDLEELRLIVNTLKHNSDTCGPQLFALRRNLFRTDFNPAAINVLTGKFSDYTDYATNLSLTDEDVERAFFIITKSAPR